MYRVVAELEKAADLARARKDYEQAILYFQAALRKDRKNSVLYNKLGLAQLKNNDLDAARLSFESAVKLNSKFADAVNNVGAVDYMIGVTVPPPAPSRRRSLSMKLAPRFT